jgi:hypothetical protein
MRDHFGPAEAPVNEIRVLTSKNEINVQGDIDRLELNLISVSTTASTDSSCRLWCPFGQGKLP